jgi:hypothetical protein
VENAEVVTGDENKFNDNDQRSIASSFHLEREGMGYAPFDSKGGLRKMWQLFGEKADEIINELNEEWVA